MDVDTSMTPVLTNDSWWSVWGIELEIAALTLVGTFLLTLYIGLVLASIARFYVLQHEFLNLLRLRGVLSETEVQRGYYASVLESVRMTVIDYAKLFGQLGYASLERDLVDCAQELDHLLHPLKAVSVEAFDQQDRENIRKGIAAIINAVIGMRPSLTISLRPLRAFSVSRQSGFKERFMDKIKPSER